MCDADTFSLYRQVFKLLPSSVCEVVGLDQIASKAFFSAGVLKLWMTFQGLKKMSVL